MLQKILPSDISSRISVVSIVSTLLIHSKFIFSRWCDVVDPSCFMGRLSTILQLIVSENLCRIGVPIFFLTSGFFIAFNNNGSKNSWVQKIKKRCKTLLIPYLIFNILWLLISVATAKIQIDSVSQVINYILINPIPFQFWFLQHLMLLSLASIIIIRVLNVKGEVTVGILTLCYIFSNTGSFGAWQESLLFYTLGCYLANNYQRISWKGLNKIFIPIYCGLIILCVWSQYVGISNTHYYIFKAIHRFSILIGTFAALAWVVSSKKAYKPLLSSGGRFMIYALHEPMQSFVKNIFVLYVSSQIGILLGYMFIPIVVILICIVLYRMVLTVNPKIASIITGGR